MTHDEYVTGLSTFGDAPEEARTILDHVASCTLCGQEHREIERLLDPRKEQRNSPVEAALRWAAAAAIVVIVVLGSQRPAEEPAEPEARYRIVGDASGVVAYTPGGVLVGTAATISKDTEVSR